jgi:DNA helicase-2/ATP-dependent DNA helicase PcrA
MERNGTPSTLLEKVLQSLNTNQYNAVASPAGRLQIIAGPGTGKTKVLVSRVAYLLLEEGIEPQNIIVTTFTKKAANEMTERLQSILENTAIDVSKVLIGTFHSICYRIIKIYGKKIGLQDYTIADERDSDQILKEVLEGLTGTELDFIKGIQDEEMYKTNDSENKYHGYDPKKIKRQISKLKATGIVPGTYSKSSSSSMFLSLIYQKYQTKLQSNSLLDFDDCLMFCYILITNHPVLNFVKHVLVDEFQDTNEIQLRLMYEFARGHPTNKRYQRNVTIVGDPDQSIYAFRHAQSINFEKMKAFYENDCKIITLTENYRSTSDILKISETIMRQQQMRTSKVLKSQLQTSFMPVYHNLNSSEEESRWIVYQIEHLMILPNSPFKYSDISILVRSAYQTRVIENELVRRRIPYVMVRGKAFWDRKEVVAMMDYLRIVANPNDRIAYLRTINFPKRGIGEKTLAAINHHLEIGAATNGSLLVLESLEQLVETNNKILTTRNQQQLQNYLKFVVEARDLLCNLDDEDSTQKIKSINKLFDYILINSGLRKEFEQDLNQELNISEIQKQLCDFTPKDEDLPKYIGSTENDILPDNRNFLAKFIHAVGLYETDTKLEDESENKVKYRGKVALSTIHGAKGLEWPVVFVPGLSETLLPAKFAIDGGGPEAVDEERRCFYVATTRAKTLLYISSYTEKVGKWGRKPIETISRFVKDLVKSQQSTAVQKLFQDWTSLSNLYDILNIEKPLHETLDVSRFYEMYEKRMVPFIKGAELRISLESITKGSDYKDTGMGFTSALEVDKNKRRVGLAPSRKINKAPIISSLLQIKSPSLVQNNSPSSLQNNSPSLQSKSTITSILHEESKPILPVTSVKQVQLKKYPPNKIVKQSTKPAHSLRAPAYQVNRTLEPVATTGFKKAPPYIPSRKAPTYIPNRKR